VADQPGEMDRRTTTRAHTDCEPLAGAFVAALLRGAPSDAAAVLDDAIARDIPAVRVLDAVVTPALHEIGRRWERAEIDVAGEHLATAITHRVLARLYPELLSALPDSQPRVLVAGVEGEQHALGVRVVADVLEGAGHEVVHLGPDVPHEALVDAVVRHRPAVVGLGATLATAGGPLVRAVDELAALAPRPLLLVGGQGVPAPLRTDPRIHHAASAQQALAALAPLRRRTAAPGAAADVTTDPRGGRTAAGGFLERSTEAAAGAADEARRLARTAYRFRELAYRDPLTSVWNRRALDDRLGEIARAGLPIPPTVMVDIDFFKEINDVHGHEAGDRVLAAVAAAICANVREGDFVARYGGDEFAILLPGAGEAEARRVAERMRRTVAEAVDLPVTLSIGVGAQTQDRRLALLAADKALYEAKRAGRNRVAAERA
jgi:diguanylate cyclase (GGDEF)-like protein